MIFLKRTSEIKFPIHYKNLIITNNLKEDGEFLVIIQRGRHGKERIEIPAQREDQGHPGWARFVDREGKAREIMSSGHLDFIDSGNPVGVQPIFFDLLAEILEIPVAILKESIDQAVSSIVLAEAIKSLEENDKRTFY